MNENTPPVSVLSEDSLTMLDQVSALTKKDFNQLFLFIESLRGIEKKVFIDLFKEENKKLHDIYTKKITEIQNKLFEEQQQRIQTHNKEQELRAKKFAEDWSFDKVELVLRQFNPSLCGILIKNDIYYKELSLKDSIPYLFIGFGDSSYEAILPFVLLEINKTSFDRPYQTYNSCADVTKRFCLCTCVESRKQIIEDLHNRVEGIKKMHKNEGFLCAYDKPAGDPVL